MYPPRPAGGGYQPGAGACVVGAAGQFGVVSSDQAFAAVSVMSEAVTSAAKGNNLFMTGSGSHQVATSSGPVQCTGIQTSTVSTPESPGCR
jgi:hypothetical protein